MIRTDKKALICDFAETYHIYDYRSLPARMVATFCVGLRNDSRVYKSLTNNNILNNDTLLAILIDDLRRFVCALAEKENKQPSIYSLLTGITEKENAFGFATVEEFEKVRKSIIERG